MINLALKDYPKNSELWRLLWYTYEIEWDYKKAEEYYKKAVDNNNKNALAYANLWHLYYILWDNNLAETYLKLSLKLDDENDYVLLNLADVYNAKWTTQKAEEYYKKVLKSSYNNYMKAQASYNLWNIYYDKNNLEKAEEYYKKSVNYYDKFDLWYIWMSKVLFSKYVLSVKNWKEDKELYEKSKEYLEKALKLNPNRVYAYYLMWLQYQALWDNSKAVKYYKLWLRKVYKDDIPNSLKIEYKNTLTNLINSLK
jgi:tetratricopeptide (TPR) repeat protein